MADYIAPQGTPTEKEELPSVRRGNVWKKNLNGKTNSKAAKSE